MIALTVLFALALAGDPSSPALNLPTQEGVVTDAAHVFTDKDHKKLEELLTAFNNEVDRTFLVLTVPTLQELPIFEYSQKLRESWGLNGNKDFILLLIAKEEKDKNVGFGENLLGLFLGLIGDVEMKIADGTSELQLQREEFGKAALLLVHALIAKHQAEYPSRTSVTVYPAPPNRTGGLTDSAGLFTREQARVLSAQIETYNNATGNDLVVVTMPSYGKHLDAERYAAFLAEEWKIKSEPNYILIVAFREEVEVTVAFGDNATELFEEAAASETGKLVQESIKELLKDHKLREILELSIKNIFGASAKLKKK